MRWPRAGSAEIRAREFADAAGIMGLAAHRMLDIPDGRVEVTWANKLKIIEVLRAHRPKIVFAPYWVDRHPDHEQTSHLVREAAYLAGLKKIETGQPPFRPHKVIYYQSRFEFTPSFIVDISGCARTKDEGDQGLRVPVPSPGPGRIRERRRRSSAGPNSWRASKPGTSTTAARSARNTASLFSSGKPSRLKDPVEFFGPEYLWTRP